MPSHPPTRAPFGSACVYAGTDSPAVQLHLMEQRWSRILLNRLNLRVRLSLMISALMLLSTVAGGLFVIHQARVNIREEVRSTMALTGHYLDAELDNLRDSRGITYDPSRPLFQLNRLRRIRHLEITYYDQDGRLMEISATAPLKSRAPSWFEWLVRVSSPPMPDERRKVDLNGLPLGTLVMHPDPAFEIEKMWQLSRGLLELLGVFFLLINLVVWWAVSRALRPIERVLGALGEVEQGNLSARLPRFTLPEMLRLSTGFNHMVGALERSTAENRQLTRRLIELQEQERRYIARELHDEIGQCVTAIHADAATIRDIGGAQQPVVSESAAAIVEVAERIKMLVRGMLQRLRPATLDRLGLEPALRELVGGYRGRHPQIHCGFTVTGDLGTLDDEFGIALYRVVQECLTNIERHAHAARVEISLERLPGPDRIHLRIRDDGRGFQIGSSPGGIGLHGMRERIQALDGRFMLTSSPDAGTEVNVDLPIAGGAGT